MPKLIMLSLIFITMSNIICVLLREVRCLGQNFFCLNASVSPSYIYFSFLLSYIIIYAYKARDLTFK